MLREPLAHLTFDVELLGDCDRIVNQVCLMLGGEEWRGPVHRDLLSQHQGLPDSLKNHEDETGAGTESVKNEDNHKTDMNSDITNKTSDNHETNRQDIREDETHNSSEGNGADQEDDAALRTSHADQEDEPGEDDWKMKSLSDYIPAGTFLYLPPSRSVFIFLKSSVG